jgi:2-oxoglutarate dehydrogenase E2 component (dihydrolipoamide succinyltransferase)
MTVELRIPEVGESVTEAILTRWLKVEGDRVEKDEPVAELETDKVDVELPSPASGVIASLTAKEGDAIPVGGVIGTIEEGDAARSSAAAGRARASQPETPPEQPPPEEPTRKEPPREDPARPEPTRKDPPTREPPRREPPSKEPARRAPPARQPTTTPPPSRPQSPRRAPAEEPPSEEPTRERPPREQPAREPPTRDDPPDEQAPRSEPPPQGPPTPQARARRETPAGSEREEEIVPMTAIRRRIAKRLVEAQLETALTTTFNETDMTAVQTLRRQWRESFEERHGVRLGLMSFFVKAAVDALRRYPKFNARIDGDRIVFRGYQDIGVAVATDRGLVVPVVRNAERLGFAEIEQSIADLARRARAAELGVEDLAGGTFTITNGGVFGSMLSVPLVNPPQTAVLGLHAIQDRPVARDGQVVIRPMMYVALTYDHRLVDGAEAVTFLRRIKEVVEEPARLLLES